MVVNHQAPSAIVRAVLGTALFFVLLLPQASVYAARDQPVAERLSKYLQVNTTNPPGNEVAGTNFLGAILADAGIEYTVVESAPGRANLWARLPASDPDRAKPGIVLLHHIDVVSASSGHWDMPPFSGAIQDGYVYGRGALDTKGLGIMQLQAFLALAESGARLNRDVIYLATADEEAGGYFGAGWLVKQHPEIFEGIGFVLNEGGFGIRFSAALQMMSVEVTQKVPLWLRLTTTGRPGHGSMPQQETAVTRLVQAASRIIEAEFPVRVVDAVDVMFKGMAPFQRSEQERMDYADVAAAIKRPGFIEQLQREQPGNYAVLKNTCQLTRLIGSDKINVVPPQASLELDCRLLPDQSPQAFIAGLQKIVDDPAVEFETLVSWAPSISSSDTELFRAIEATTEKYNPGTALITGVSAAFTDSHFFRELGIVSYGYSPVLLAPAELRGIHGNNERISVDAMEQGARVLTELLSDFAVGTVH
ncbi:MAG: M20/M25/M40 family metallo-hydrolase [Halieaceae bacterium]